MYSYICMGDQVIEDADLGSDGDVARGVDAVDQVVHQLSPIPASVPAITQILTI